MKVSELIILLLIFSGCAVGMSSFYTNLFENYDVAGARNLSSLNKTAELTATLSDVQSNIKTEQAGEVGFQDYAYMALVGVYQGFLTLLNLPFIVSAILADLIGLQIGIPAWFTTLISAIVSVIIIFAVIAVFMKKEL